MSDPEIGDNSTQVPNDILLRLVGATEEIRDLLRQRADKEITTAQEIDGVSNQSEDSPEETYFTTQESFNTDTESVKTDNGSYDSDDRDSNGTNSTIYFWPNDDTIAKYRDRCAKHKSECEKMQVELGCFIAHLGIVGGDNKEIEKAESLQEGLLDPVQSLEKAFDATHDGRPTAMNKVQNSFARLFISIRDLGRSPHQKDALYPDKVEQWRGFTYNGWDKIYDLVRDGKFVECSEFIHDVFFSELETAMGGVVEALTAFEEKFASEWLARQKIKDYESWCAEYIKIVFPSSNGIGEQGGWPESHEYEHFGQRLAQHRRLCDDMRVELDHLASHYIIIGGDKEVIEASNILKEELLSHAQYFEDVVRHRPEGFQTKMRGVITKLLFAVIRFQSSLYHQKHAFYFRNVKQWVICLWSGAHIILRLLQRGEEFKCMSYVHNTFLLEFDRAMMGITLGELMESEEKSFDAVPEELKTFGKESLPKFLVDQMERDTTRYINLTTIATFFSSVTATTLQFTYAPTDSEPSNSLRGVVNLFWFLSLVFSVSSGVSSLLGLTWRKSSIYDSRVPPKLIRMWFDKAPMLFLIIAAVAFVIGLNMFAYLSLQPRYVSFSTTILTGIHGACLLTVTAWFIYQLKHDTVWVKWIGKVLQWTGRLRVWTWISGAWEWIGKVWKWIKDLLISSWRWMRHPRQQYRLKKLHLQRNFFWAFGFDNRVARLNYDIDWRLDWPGPYLLSKLIRCIAYPITGCWLVTKKALSGLSRTVQAHICVSSHTEHAEGDVEMGKSVRREDAKVPEEMSFWNPAKNEFRKSLQAIFSESERVDWIMGSIDLYQDEIMRNDAFGLQYLRARLWGYPDLVKKLFEVIGPALVEEREKRRREREEAEQQNLTMEQIDDGPEVVADDKDDTAPAPSQSSESAVLDRGTGLPDATKPESQGQLEDHSPALDDRPLSTAASATTEALEPTPGILIPQTNMEEVTGTPKEIEEVPSTSDNTNEEPRIAQRKEESGE